MTTAISNRHETGIRLDEMKPSTAFCFKCMYVCSSANTEWIHGWLVGERILVVEMEMEMENGDRGVCIGTLAVKDSF